MFGPGRGAWDETWTGWWGPEPPYHAPVFVLTHHERAPLEMRGGTTFTFVTDGASGPRPDPGERSARSGSGSDLAVQDLVGHGLEGGANGPTGNALQGGAGRVDLGLGGVAGLGQGG